MKIFHFDKKELEDYVKNRINNSKTNSFIVGFYNDLTTEKGRYWALIFQHCYEQKLEFIYNFKSPLGSKIEVTFSKKLSKNSDRFGEYSTIIKYIN